MSTTFLVLSIVGLAFVVNAARPLRATPAFVPAFFAAWLTIELAPQLLVLHLAGTLAFVLAGAVEGWKGILALGFSALVAAGLARLVGGARRVHDIVEAALRQGLGPEYASRIPPETAAPGRRVPWRPLIFPFLMRDPDVERVRNIAYAEGGRRRSLDVYRHRSAPEGCPTLLFLHGGGWTISNKNQQGKPLMLHLASRGWVCVAANYRLSPRATWPDHLIDVKRALAWIREHGASFGADPSFVVVTGGSAGGHLAALAALTQDDPAYQPGFEAADTSVQAAVPFYGVYDLTNEDGTRKGRQMVRFLERVVIKKPFADHRRVFESASPVYLAREDAPPFFVVHGGIDTLAPVAVARRFVARLRERSRAPVVYAELPGTQHAFDVFRSIRTAHVVAGVERFCDYVRATSAALRS